MRRRRDPGGFNSMISSWEAGVRSGRSSVRGRGTGLRGGSGLGPGSVGQTADLSTSEYVNWQESAVEDVAEGYTPGGKTKQRNRNKAQQRAKAKRQQKMTPLQRKRRQKVTKVAKKVVKRQKAAGNKITPKQARAKARAIIKKRRK